MVSDPAGDLRIGPELTIPAGEFRQEFVTSGGPGGQHANRSATAVALTWSFSTSSALSPAQQARLAERLGERGRHGSIRVVADRSRSQWRNRSRARSQLAAIVRDALRTDPDRRPTTPSAASRQRRLSSKRHRGETKRLRRRPDID